MKKLILTLFSAFALTTNAQSIGTIGEVTDKYESLKDGECSDLMYDRLATMIAQMYYAKDGAPVLDIYVHGMNINRVESCVLTDLWFANLIKSATKMTFGGEGGKYYIKGKEFFDGIKDLNKFLARNKSVIRTKEDSIFRNRGMFGYIVAAEFSQGEYGAKSKLVACVNKELNDILWVQPDANMKLWLYTIENMKRDGYLRHPLKFDLRDTGGYFGGYRMTFARTKKVVNGR